MNAMKRITEYIHNMYMFHLSAGLSEQPSTLKTMVCKKIFLIKAKKILCTGYPKSVFEYFQKIPSEINSTDPFYPILIPNTS